MGNTELHTLDLAWNFVKSGIMNLSGIYIEHKWENIPSVVTTLLLGGALGPFETLQLVFCTEPRLHRCESGLCSK